MSADELKPAPTDKDWLQVEWIKDGPSTGLILAPLLFALPLLLIVVLVVLR